MTEGRAAIDALRAPDGSLDRAAILALLPYGEDFLFVDRVLALDEQSVEASFCIPEDAAYLRAHFRDLPLMPGVLIAEGLAQAASLIVRYNLAAPERHHVLGLEVERARFTSPARPGDTLLYSAKRGVMNRRAARIKGEARVGDTTVCRASVTVAIIEKSRLRERLGGGR